AGRGVVLATGSRPRMPPGQVADGRRVVTSDDALYAPGLTTDGRGHVRSPWIRRAGAWTESSAGSSSGRSSPGPRRAPGSSRRAAGR
ncbi:hypothetical protein GT040_13920, partial [Streptomyces sp. SID2119]|nr:hypothetical protein [Streptomyces sp. SID2119]